MSITFESLQDLLEVVKQYVLPIVIAFVIVVVIYIIISKVLSKIRSRGIVSRGVEEAVKMAVLIASVIIVIPLTLSSWFQVFHVAITFIAILLLLAGFMLYYIRSYAENTLSYIIFISSNVVKDGEYVRVSINNEVYEGKISISEGGYAVIESDDKKVYIPYSLLIKSVITKTIRNKAMFKLTIRGQSLELSRIVNDVMNILSSELKMINRESIYITPITVSDDEVVLNISMEILNPRNIDECYKTLTELLMRRFPYKFSIEFR